MEALRGFELVLFGSDKTVFLFLIASVVKNCYMLHRRDTNDKPRKVFSI